MDSCSLVVPLNAVLFDVFSFFWYFRLSTQFYLVKRLDDVSDLYRESSKGAQRPYVLEPDLWLEEPL